MKDSKQHEVDLRRLLAVLILGIALTAGLSLWVLLRLHHRQVHTAATRNVLQLGVAMDAYLAGQTEVVSNRTVTSWEHFSALVQSFYTVEQGLQYVAVTENGVSVFHRQVAPHPSGETVQLPARERSGPEWSSAPLPRNVRLRLKVLRTGDHDIPVVTFTKDVVSVNGSVKSVEVALRREIVDREAAGPVAATTAMFEVAVVTVAVAFGFCIILVLWVMRREEAYEKRRQKEEHLAFAGSMAGGVVHDFRNPLSSLKLDVQMLREEADSEAAGSRETIKELATRATHAAERMEEVLQQFLSLSSPQEEEQQAMDLGVCVKDCLKMIETRLARQKVTVDARMMEDHLQVSAYATSLRRGLLNVLMNAEQHSPQGGRIVVSLRREEEMALLEVADCGPGIPAGERDHVFEKFVTTRPGGTGLGLFLARTAIEKCGGTIDVTEAEGGGACFSMRLPLAGVTASHAPRT